MQRMIMPLFVLALVSATAQAAEVRTENHGRMRLGDYCYADKAKNLFCPLVPSTDTKGATDTTAPDMNGVRVGIKSCGPDETGTIVCSVVPLDDKSLENTTKTPPPPPAETEKQPGAKLEVPITPIAPPTATAANTPVAAPAPISAPASGAVSGALVPPLNLGVQPVQQ